MNILFDASAMFKRYSGEAGVDRVLQLQAAASAVTAAVHCKSFCPKLTACGACRNALNTTPRSTPGFI